MHLPSNLNAFNTSVKEPSDMVTVNEKLPAIQILVSMQARNFVAQLEGIFNFRLIFH